jgi:hypothetical protein
MAEHSDSSRLGPRRDSPADLHERSQELEARLEAMKWWRTRLFVQSLANIPLLLALVVLVVAIVLAANEEDARWLAGLVAAAVAINLVIFGVARATRRFAWLGVAVFLSVPIFGGVLSAVRTVRAPKLQPAALIRKSDNVGLCGIYIPETDKRVYLGRIEPRGGANPTSAEGGTGRIFWVPTDDVDMIKIGTLQPLRDANTRAALLLTELYHDRAEDPGVARKNTTVTTTKTQNGTQTVTAVEKAPHPSAQATPRPAPKTSATVCTDVKLTGAKPPAEPGTVPKDDSPHDP